MSDQIEEQDQIEELEAGYAKLVAELEALRTSANDAAALNEAVQAELRKTITTQAEMGSKIALRNKVLREENLAKLAELVDTNLRVNLLDQRNQALRVENAELKARIQELIEDRCGTK